MKRYGIIGGTFDPIHNAHLYIAYEAKEQLNLDKVIFMPAGQQPLKTEKKVTPAWLRYEMVREAIKPYEDFSISDYEIQNEGLSYTYKTLEHFKKLYKDSELFFITGADCLIDIDKWTEVSKIFKVCTFVVFSRGGIDTELLHVHKKKAEEKYGGKIIILELKDLEISSTDIRNRIKLGKKAEFFVPEKVNEFIKKNNLYR
ncbi:nicotinate-nucleotide adenylyltransferase [Clostridium sp. SM-530-WT-3G]|uniref:nicotinate-nucleotide adenylyltransferase n=1 Tax=Clostridium sp. SM-530-WT-3G TaxID=2725303 RepID=UPI00145E9A8E|nr:nicotinate-nucleotide adenylyltransferase [Clostridium sp. SM-530-WT-3G]NME82169.1 nicotinate-nucleotide adenylyltransferase [Clostridium sp. SM-530-WT-3G]